MFNPHFHSLLQLFDCPRLPHLMCGLAPDDNWFLCPIAAKSITSQPPVGVRGGYMTPCMHSSTAAIFRQVPLSPCGSVHLYHQLQPPFPAAPTQKASLSELFKHECRGKGEFKRGWLGLLNAAKCTRVKRSSGCVDGIKKTGLPQRFNQRLIDFNASAATAESFTVCSLLHQDSS